MKVIVTYGQVLHNGVIHTAGACLDLSKDQAEHLVRDGFCTVQTDADAKAAKEAEKAAAKEAEKAAKEAEKAAKKAAEAAAKEAAAEADTDDAEEDSEEPATDITAKDVTVK